MSLPSWYDGGEPELRCGLNTINPCRYSSQNQRRDKREDTSRHHIAFAHSRRWRPDILITVSNSFFFFFFLVCFCTLQMQSAPPQILTSRASAFFSPRAGVCHHNSRFVFLHQQSQHKQWDLCCFFFSDLFFRPRKEKEIRGGAGAVQGGWAALISPAGAVTHPTLISAQPGVSFLKCSHTAADVCMCVLRVCSAASEGQESSPVSHDQHQSSVKFAGEHRLKCDAPAQLKGKLKCLLCY